ncbi:hypothetical protein MNBD_GAMMA13-1815 [hydrothermal vent metagenome]|uniref:Uncharacterized protein n=1 Tax=hydrothermal vent metagenome TaxID=652676 RepID=A0A3B0YPW8_9ZZZZ
MSCPVDELNIESVPAAAPRDKKFGLALINLYRPKVYGFLVLLVYISVLLVIYLGWTSRVAQPLTAESGIGYTLGIVGGSMMLLLLFYPLRKHWRVMRRLGPIKYWFRTHMIFGVLGPLLVLFHSGFQLGSLNSRVALFSTLLVASSGLVGRYIYTKIHHGLYGSKATLDELVSHSELLEKSLTSMLSAQAGCTTVMPQIEAFQQQAMKRSAGFFISLLRLVYLGTRTWFLYLSLWLRMPRSLPFQTRRLVIQHLGAHLESIRRVAEFQFYERLFSLWHVLHLPLFLMLIFSGIVHVIAVHMY